VVAVTVVGLRARKKERTRTELARAALSLFAEVGFDATTIESIAEAVDVSPRTFFRYFSTKEDVLFGDDVDESGRRRSELVRAELRDHPGAAAPGAMLRDALASVATTYESELPILLLRKQVIAATPSLQGRAVQRRHSWEAAVVDQLAERFGDDPATLLSLRVTVATTTAGLHVALDTWLESGGRLDLGVVLAEVWQHLIDGIDRPTARSAAVAARGPRGGGNR
jgi:AcrR family transcriptional regulator